jgi:hypothetical protein
MKQCSSCKKWYPYDKFYKNKAQPDGYANQCIVCYKASSRKYRTSPLGLNTRQTYVDTYFADPQNCETDRLEQIRYQHSAKGQIVRQRYVQSPKGKATARRRKQRSRIQHPERHQAREAVKYAVRSGKLPHPSTQTCHCGNQAEHWHHHLGYAKEHRLSVTAVCRVCHEATHRILY